MYIYIYGKYKYLPYIHRIYIYMVHSFVLLFFPDSYLPCSCTTRVCRGTNFPHFSPPGDNGTRGVKQTSGFPIKNGGSFHSYVSLPEGNARYIYETYLTIKIW